MSTTTTTRRAQIAQRLTEATPGPWECPDDRLRSADGGLCYVTSDHEAEVIASADAQFIAACPDDVRWLLDRLRVCAEALRAWETWRAANESKVNDAIVLATIHGCPYTGDAWPDQQGREALAALAEHGGPR